MPVRAPYPSLDTLKLVLRALEHEPAFRLQWSAQAAVDRAQARTALRMAIAGMEGYQEAEERDRARRVSAEIVEPAAADAGRRMLDIMANRTRTCPGCGRSEGPCSASCAVEEFRRALSAAANNPIQRVEGRVIARGLVADVIPLPENAPGLVVPAAESLVAHESAS